MKFSDSGWSPEMHPAIWMARGFAQVEFEKWTGQEFVITSGPRPQRAGGSSLHAVGRAFDFRIRNMFKDAGDVRQFTTHLQGVLGPDFDVILEGPDGSAQYRTFPNGKERPPHIHVEYDPKGRLAEQVP